MSLRLTLIKFHLQTSCAAEKSSCGCCTRQGSDNFEAKKTLVVPCHWKLCAFFLFRNRNIADYRKFSPPSLSLGRRIVWIFLLFSSRFLSFHHFFSNALLQRWLHSRFCHHAVNQGCYYGIILGNLKAWKRGSKLSNGIVVLLHQQWKLWQTCVSTAVLPI